MAIFKTTPLPIRAMNEHVVVNANFRHFFSGVATLVIAGAALGGAVRGTWGFFTPDPGETRGEKARAQAWEGVKSGVLIGSVLAGASAGLEYFGRGGPHTPLFS